jgi:hypothetical protein
MLAEPFQVCVDGRFVDNAREIFVCLASTSLPETVQYGNDELHSVDGLAIPAE